MPDEVEAATPASRDGVAVLVFVRVSLGQLRGDRDERRMQRGNCHDALL
jgi:hypothetical protein